MIEAKDLRVTFKGKEVINATFSTEGKCLLLGPNGSGKTTLLRAIAGVIPYKGSVRMGGQEVRNVRNMVYVSTNLPEAFTLGITMKDVIDLYSEIKELDQSLLMGKLKDVGIDDLSKKVHELSTGQSILFRTAIATSTNSKLILIDEPFENVDLSKRKKVAMWIKESGEEGLVVTHELEMIHMFENFRAILILDGRTFGPVKAKDLISSVLVEGVDPSSVLTVEAYGRKFSFVKNREGIKVADSDSLERIFSRYL